MNTKKILTVLIVTGAIIIMAIGFITNKPAEKNQGLNTKAGISLIENDAAEPKKPESNLQKAMREKTESYKKKHGKESPINKW